MHLCERHVSSICFRMNRLRSRIQRIETVIILFCRRCQYYLYDENNREIGGISDRMLTKSNNYYHRFLFSRNL